MNKDKMQMMSKIQEYWVTASGEPELGEFADYLLKVVEEERLKAQLSALKNLVKEDATYNWDLVSTVGLRVESMIEQIEAQLQEENSKAIAKLSFHTGIDIKTLNGYLASKGKDASQYRQNYAKSVLEPVKEQSNV